jgi:hypothetical protein
MSTFDPPPKAEFNPYAPPTAPVEGPSPKLSPEHARIDAIRKKYLNHEASVQSVGSLHLLGAILTGLWTLGVLASVLSDLGALTAFDLLLGMLCGGLTALNLWVGSGLRRLSPRVRWVEVALVCLSIVCMLAFSARAAFTMFGVRIVFLFSLIWLSIPAYILYLLLSDKAKMVFSPEYHEVMYQTPHIRYRMSCLMRGFVYAIVILVGVSTVMSFMRYYFR